MATQQKRRTANAKKAPAKKAAAPARMPEPMVVPTYDDSKITSADQWGAVNVGQVIELPSGAFARVRRTLNLPSLLQNNKIPNPLADIIKDQMRTRSDRPDFSGDEEGEAVVQLMQFVRSQMPELFVSPKVEMKPEGWDEAKQGVWMPSEGALSVDQIALEDQMYVFSYAQGAAMSVARFREVSAQGVASLQHVNNLADTTSNPDGGD